MVSTLMLIFILKVLMTVGYVVVTKHIFHDVHYAMIPVVITMGERHHFAMCRYCYNGVINYLQLYRFYTGDKDACRLDDVPVPLRSNFTSGYMV